MQGVGAALGDDGDLRAGAAATVAEPFEVVTRNSSVESSVERKTP